MVECLARMEARGIAIDRAILSRLSGEFAQDMARLEAEIFELAGETFNLGSPKQLGDILFGKMGLPAREEDRDGRLVDGGRRARRSRRARAITSPRAFSTGASSPSSNRPIPTPCRATSIRRRSASIRPMRSRRRRPGGCRRRNPICRIFRCATRPAARSAAPSSRRRAISSSRPIIRRSNCGCSRISPTSRNCAKPSRRASTFTR